MSDVASRPASRCCNRPHVVRNRWGSFGQHNAQFLGVVEQCSTRNCSKMISNDCCGTWRERIIKPISIMAALPLLTPLQVRSAKDDIVQNENSFISTHNKNHELLTDEILEQLFKILMPFYTYFVFWVSSIQIDCSGCVEVFFSVSCWNRSSGLIKLFSDRDNLVICQGIEHVRQSCNKGQTVTN